MTDPIIHPDPIECHQYPDGTIEIGGEEYVQRTDLDRAVEFAHKYGTHNLACNRTLAHNSPCSCGYEEALAALPDPERER